jgi:hypothetical protein
MTKTRHLNKYLNSSEVAILKAWAWEEAHRDKDGPAHKPSGRLPSALWRN